jgi:hypothetical protein
MTMGANGSHRMDDMDEFSCQGEMETGYRINLTRAF